MDISDDEIPTPKLLYMRLLTGPSSDPVFMTLGIYNRVDVSVNPLKSGNGVDCVLLPGVDCILLPPMTQERAEELVEHVPIYGELFKAAIRDVTAQGSKIQQSIVVWWDPLPQGHEEIIKQVFRHA
jgi:hypothetical protein